MRLTADLLGISTEAWLESEAEPAACPSRQTELCELCARGL